MEENTPLCDNDCNRCQTIHNRRFSLLVNTYVKVFGQKAEQIAQEVCPNFTVCPDCRIDDFCHLCNDDGEISCEISNQAAEIAKKYLKRINRSGK